MAIAASEVALTIPTRGDVDLEPILSSLPDFGDVVVWDNSVEQDLAVYGRYAAIERTDKAIIATQDDDAIVPWGTILKHYEPGRLIANMDRARWGPGWGYPDSTLIGWGGLFDRDLPEKAFDYFEQNCGLTTYLAEEPEFKRIQQGNYIVQSNSPHRKYEPGRGWLTNADFHRTCDVVFSALTPRTVIDVGFRHLPWADGPGRMWTSGPNHSKERNEMLELCRAIRTWEDDDVRIS